MKLRYTPRAFRELSEVFAYIEGRSPVGASSVKSRIYEVIDLIARQPRAGRLTGNRGLRRVATNPYADLIFYRVGAQEIVVQGVRHGARNPSSMPR